MDRGAGKGVDECEYEYATDEDQKHNESIPNEGIYCYLESVPLLKNS